MFYLDRLPNKKSDEKIILFLRRHWFAPLKIFLTLVILCAVLVAIYFIIKSEAPQFLSSPTITPLLALAGCLYLLGAWVYSFSEFIDYYLDAWIITTERIINIEQHGLFSRTASELNIDTVQDVTSEIKGFIPTFFDYGNVYIQTAGERQRFVFRDVEHPEKIKEQIIGLHQRFASETPR